MIIKNGQTKYHVKNNVYHREDGPAIIGPDGYQAWYINGQRHRVDGPALTTQLGSQFWYQNNLLHREDGPAAIDSDGTEFYFIEGTRLSMEYVNICKEHDLPLNSSVWTDTHKIIYKLVK